MACRITSHCKPIDIRATRIRQAKEFPNFIERFAGRVVASRA
jgi:hypothetical protein